MQPGREALDVGSTLAPVLKLGEKAGGQAVLPKAGTTEGASHRSKGVGVVALADGAADRRLEGVGRGCEAGDGGYHRAVCLQTVAEHADCVAGPQLCRRREMPLELLASDATQQLTVEG